MELPWLKNKPKNQGGGSSIERDPDGGASLDRLVGMVSDEAFAAIQTKNRVGFREALRALVDVVRQQDEAEDDNGS